MFGSSERCREIPIVLDLSALDANVRSYARCPILRSMCRTGAIIHVIIFQDGRQQMCSLRLMTARVARLPE